MEIDILKKISSKDNIVAMLDCAATSNNLYIFLEYIDGNLFIFLFFFIIL